MPKKPTHYIIKLGQSVRHPDHPDILLTPKNGEIVVTAEIKDKLGDAVAEARPADDGEV